MHRIRCSEVWGGIQDVELDVATSGLTVSLYSAACDGGKGGDVYYFSVCGSDKLTRIAVADVAGHGEAVSHMSQWLYDALVERMNSLEGNGILTDLNSLIHSQGSPPMATAAVVAFYLGDSNLYFSYAGHPPLLLRRKDDSGWKSLELQPSPTPGNLPLGLLREAPYDQEEAPLMAGDRMFLYTDGVTDGMNSGGDCFGYERLLEVLDLSDGESLAGVKNAVLGALRSQTGGSLGHDDVTLMMIEVR